MRRAPVGVALVALILLVVLASVTGKSASQPRVTTSTAPVTAATVVCPAVDGTPTATTTRAVVVDAAGALSPPSNSHGVVASTVLAGAKSTTTIIKPAPAVQLGSTSKDIRSLAITATGSIAATLAADQIGETGTGRSRALTDSRCAAPATDWWFAGADGRVGYSDSLILTNPAATPAAVAVSLWSATGVVTSDRLAAIPVPAASAVRIAIASVAPDAATLAVHVHATSGAVTAAMLDRRTSALQSDGGDFLPATEAPSTSAVVAGFTAGKGTRQLVVGNPGGVDATVSLKLVTQSGSFVPSGIAQEIVKAGHTRLIGLSRALDGTTGAVEVTSDQPVVSQGLVVVPSPPRRPDLMWLAATPSLQGPAAVADGREPDGGHTLLLLSAPGAAAQVRLSGLGGGSTTESVPAGRSVAVEVPTSVHGTSPDWGFVVTPIGSAPVYGVRVLEFAGAHGALVTGEPLVALPPPISLPAVREDPSAAMR